ncbi:putative bifunctional diguanylate cyclase/phosphodiesterase [Oryzibacter oryziterrae]|uniref:putative bifunctional diguanylate cyclase/phosphodiesterase n=1 Tax=Oryzibacter oryziterrae TaxID=2766474 RepID=UPI001F3032D5|nr:EAL domain-containing protein [Oryzibacter oryziterrae]
MSRFRFSFPRHDPELAQAQLAAFAHQIPLLYFILLVNTVAVSVTHYHMAPAWLTVGVPCALFAVCLKRFLGWIGTHRRQIPTNIAVRRLNSTIALAVLLGIAFSVWSLSLYPYGDMERHMHLAYYMSLTLIGIVFCLMHLRAAALGLIAAVVPAFLVFFGTRGSIVLTAIAINFALVSGAMLTVLLTYYRDFASLISSRKQLLVQTESARRLSDENFRLANLDALTGLPNRRRFLYELEQRVAQAQAVGGAFVVGVIDLDGFKPVNDAFGHAVGDKVLIEAGLRLQAAASERIFLARLGGDEFGVIISGAASDDELHAIGDQLSTALRKPINLSGIVARVSGSCGFARFPENGRASAALFERADYALYFAKHYNRGQSTIFSGSHEAKLSEQARIEQALQAANLEAEMHLMYQPVVDTDTQKTIAFEALARWVSPALGSIGPATFIAIAERSGMISRLTEILFRKALAEAHRWPDDVGLSFNLSVHDLSLKNMGQRLAAIIDTAKINPARISFEITETSVMKDAAVAQANLDALIALGCSIALDDFGTGQSNLAYVHQLPLSKIKIDRSFIGGIEANKVSRDLIRTIIDLSRNLGCMCVTEGVETAAQVIILRTLGCRYIQGYFYGKPMTGNEALARIAGERVVGIKSATARAAV